MLLTPLSLVRCGSVCISWLCSLRLSRYTGEFAPPPFTLPVFRVRPTLYYPQRPECLLAHRCMHLYDNGQSLP